MGNSTHTLSFSGPTRTEKYGKIIEIRTEEKDGNEERTILPPHFLVFQVSISHRPKFGTYFLSYPSHPHAQPIIIFYTLRYNTTRWLSKLLKFLFV